MTHLFATMLWAAAGLAFLARMPELGTTIIVDRPQRRRRVRAGAPRRACSGSVAIARTPTRHGRAGRRAQVIPADQLVRGDLVQLAAGDRVSADLDLVESANLAIDSSLFTGESVPAPPPVVRECSRGTFVTEGEGAGVVAATGPRTRLAAITALTGRKRSPRTPLAKELERVVHRTALIAAAVGGAFFVVALVMGLPPTEGFLFGVGVTVALVPAGLLPTITLSLAVGAKRMAERHALVRRLDAVETLGATTFICTDKAGTLTMNQMSGVAAWCPKGRADISGEGYDSTSGEVQADPEALPMLRELARAAARCSSGRAVFRDGRRRRLHAARAACPRRGDARSVARRAARVCRHRRVEPRAPRDRRARRPATSVALSGGSFR